MGSGAKTLDFLRLQFLNFGFRAQVFRFRPSGAKQRLNVLDGWVAEEGYWN